jgi:hypothetical protein
VHTPNQIIHGSNLASQSPSESNNESIRSTSLQISTRRRHVAGSLPWEKRQNKKKAHVVTSCRISGTTSTSFQGPIRALPTIYGNLPTSFKGQPKCCSHSARTSLTLRLMSGLSIYAPVSAPAQTDEDPYFSATSLR